MLEICKNLNFINFFKDWTAAGQVEADFSSRSNPASSLSAANMSPQPSNIIVHPGTIFLVVVEIIVYSRIFYYNSHVYIK